MLFNKNNEGSLEIYNLSGAFEANTPFSAIASEVISATTDVAAIIGNAVIEAAQTIYNKQTPTDEERTFLDTVRRPIAFLAVGNYARITLLRHDATGRKMVTGDNEKVPFEWMVDRDDRELRERYYRAMDALFAYLTKTNVSAWKETDAYKRASASLVDSLSKMEEVYPVDHSQYTYYMLLPLMLEAQAKLLKEIKKSDKSGIPEGVRPAAARFIVLKALITALRRWALSVFPTEVARQFAPSYQGNKEKQVATKEEIDWAIGKLEAQAAEAEAEVIEDVKGNPYKGFPLVPENDPKNKYFTT